MIITWLGEAGIRIQIKDTVVLIDPPAESTGIKLGRPTAHILAVSESSGREIKGIGGDPFLVDAPGEYERQNVFVYGLQLAADPERVHFRLEAEELSLGHLGGLKAKLDNGQIGVFEDVDVLFVPVGGKTVLNAEDAAQLVSQIEPRIVIPIQYRSPGGTAGYADVLPFLKEIGSKSHDVQEKLKITKKDLPVEETQVIVLKP